MDGYELCQELRRINFNCKVKIVLITAEESTNQDFTIFDKVYNKPMQLPLLFKEYDE